MSVKINDGIVMAADSATTFYDKEGRPTQIYEHADKVLNLIKGAPIGIMTCGSGGIGGASIVTLLKDLRKRMADKTSTDWYVDPTSYTMSKVAELVKRFFEERMKEADFKWFVLLRLCGYGSGQPLPEVWQILLDEGKIHEPKEVQKQSDLGTLWNGEPETLDRLVLGMGSLTKDDLKELGMTEQQWTDLDATLMPKLYAGLIMAAAPIQDAIDLARFMVETTKGFIRFSITRVKTVGGPVEIAAITKHEGFKWVQRKHFYPYELNRSQ